MTPAAPTSDECERLAALECYEMLDTPAEAEFDDLTSLAAQICGTPIALISLVDAHRQWFKSRVGFDASETSREVSFCGHAIHGPHLLEVPNTREEFLFYDNPLVTGEPNIQFYAGMPLATPDGQKLGTLCVMDRVPRYLTQVQRDALGRLGRQVMNQMELRLTNRRLAAAGEDLRALEERFRLLVESTPDATLLANEQGLITLVNSQMERLFGYAREELIGQPLEMLVPNFSRKAKHKDGAGPFRARASRGTRKGRSAIGRRKNGTEVPIEIGLKPLPTSAGRLILIVAVKARKRSGNQVNRLKHDLKQKRRQLEQARHELNELAATVAQDLKAPLRGIGSLANWLVTSYANRLDGSGREQLNLLALKLRRLNALAESISTCSSTSSGRLTLSNVALEVAQISPSEKTSAIAVASQNLVDRPAAIVKAGPRSSRGRNRISSGDLEPNERLDEIVAAA
jgi:PAS domain S-box-containing protein